MHWHETVPWEDTFWEWLHVQHEPPPQYFCPIAGDALVAQSWRESTARMARVFRWGKYLRDPAVRRQNVLQHTVSIVSLVPVFVRALAGYTSLDGELLRLAFMVHDVGEGELGGDVHYIDREVSRDVAEYEAFCRQYRDCAPAVWEQLERAFLLQFAAANPLGFPDDARVVMAELRGTNPVEVIAFEAIERWDYMLYALEHEARGCGRLIVQVLRNQLGHLDRLVHELPGFEVIHPPRFSSWCHDYVGQFAGQWIEQKGEK